MPFTALPVLGTFHALVDAIVRYSLETHRVTSELAGIRTLCYAQLSHRFFRLMLAVHSGRNLEVLASTREVLYSRIDALLPRLPSTTMHDVRVRFELFCAREAIICMEDTSTLMQVRSLWRGLA